MSKKIEPKEENIKLTPEQMEMVRVADEAYERGEKGHTPDDVMAHARAKVKAWLPSQSA